MSDLHECLKRRKEQSTAEPVVEAKSFEDITDTDAKAILRPVQRAFSAIQDMEQVLKSNKGKYQSVLTVLSQIIKSKGIGAVEEKDWELSKDILAQINKDADSLPKMAKHLSDLAEDAYRLVK